MRPTHIRKIKGSNSIITLNGLTHLCLASYKKDIGKQCRPDQTPQNVASDPGLHCLL